MPFRLREVGRAIAACWVSAEASTKQEIAEKYPRPSEENITFLFSGQLRCVVEEASKAGRFNGAFLRDMREHFPSLSDDILRRCSGLIARVNFHTRSHEGRLSAADLGVAITRPQVERISETEFRVLRDKARALLVQAKLGRYSPGQSGRLKWGDLSPPQQKLIPGLEAYYALLLYRFELENQLARFGWQLCQGSNVDDINLWLRNDTFPSEANSPKIIHGLTMGTLRTDSRTVIENLIDPSSSKATAIEIRIFWPDGKGPPPGALRLRNPVREANRQRVSQTLW